MGRLLDSCDGRGWKGQLSAGPPSQVMWGVNFGWIQESVYLLTMLLPAKSRWYYVGSWMYCKLVGLGVVS